MKKIVLINGFIAGLITSGMFIVSHPLIEDGTLSFEAGTYVGYASMVLGFSLIFVAIKTWRDDNGGTVTFGTGCKIGLLITLIASLMYAISWEIYFNTAARDFPEKYAAHHIDRMEQSGASQEEIATMKAEMEEFNNMYENGLFRFAITLMEIAPVGVIITLISAALLRRKEIMATSGREQSC